jgi:hypothetical protein
MQLVAVLPDADSYYNYSRPVDRCTAAAAISGLTCDRPVCEHLVQQYGREGAAAQPEAYVQPCRRVHQGSLCSIDAAQQLPWVRRLPAVKQQAHGMMALTRLRPSLT